MKVPKHLKESYPQAAPRSCLKCNKQFQSLGPQNRICPICKPKQPASKNARSIPTGDLPSSFTYLTEVYEEP